MIDKLIIDDNKIELTDKDKLPYTYSFSTAKTHIVKYAISDTDEISAGAFANCAYMTKVKFPKEIKMIKRKAFENCVRLNNVVIPETIEYIGADVWTGCSGMTEMHFEASEPPTNYAEMPKQCKVFIPNDSKYVLAQRPLNPDTVQYYSKTEYNMYKEVPARLLNDTDDYYYDNWTNIAPNDQTIEEKNKIQITGLDFIDTNIVTSVGERLTLKYNIIPENATNRKIYFFDDKNGEGAIQILDTSVEGEIIIDALRQGTVNFTIYAESGVSSKCSVRAR